MFVAPPLGGFNGIGIGYGYGYGLGGSVAVPPTGVVAPGEATDEAAVLDAADDDSDAAESSSTCNECLGLLILAMYFVIISFW